MLEKVKEAKLLIKQEKWNEAATTLQDIQGSKSIFHYQSLLYRLMDDYDNELKIVNLGLDRFPSWDYLQKRKEWHEKPLFDKLEKRPKLKGIDREKEKTPSEEVIEKFCFVTGGNSQYFTLIIECLESIEGASLYERAPIFIVDCGLTDDEKNQLVKMFPRIKKIVEPKSISSKYSYDESDRYLQSLVCRGQFQALFPGYRYYFWIDADAWIQDERGIDDFLNLAVNQGIALPIHPYQVKVERDDFWLSRNTLTKEQIEVILGTEAIIACSFCTDTFSNFYRDFHTTMDKNISSMGLNWGIDQEVLLYLTAKYRSAILPTKYAFEGIPKIKPFGDNPYALYDTDMALIKIYHLGGGEKNSKKWDYFTPIHVEMPPGKGQIFNTSLHYRVLPWREKESIKETLRAWGDAYDFDDKEGGVIID